MSRTSSSTVRRAHAQPQPEGVYAALDLGTNNCRLLIASGIEEETETRLPSAFRVVDSFSRIVKLGEGVSSTGTLSEEAMARTIAALKICKKKLARHQVLASRFVATEACRRAANSAAFISRVREETGMELEIITTEEEAQLAFLGCASLLAHGSERAVVFDIGGGSTEFMWIDVDAHAAEKRECGIAAWLSIDCGVMNLADRFGGQAFADIMFNDMVTHITRRLAPFDTEHGIGEAIADGRVQLLSTSGTVTTLAAVHLELPRYDRARVDGIRLPVKDLRSTVRKLLSMRASERFHHGCIGPDRADYILSGCAIFEAISTTWPAAEITIADRGVREGIIISLLQSK